MFSLCQQISKFSDWGQHMTKQIKNWLFLVPMQSKFPCNHGSDLNCLPHCISNTMCVQFTIQALMLYMAFIDIHSWIISRLFLHCFFQGSAAPPTFKIQADCSSTNVFKILCHNNFKKKIPATTSGRLIPRSVKIYIHIYMTLTWSCSSKTI